MASIVRPRAWAGLLCGVLLMAAHGAQAAASYDDLVALWQQWRAFEVGSSRVDLQACKLEYSIVSPK